MHRQESGVPVQVRYSLVLFTVDFRCLGEECRDRHAPRATAKSVVTAKGELPELKDSSGIVAETRPGVPRNRMRRMLHDGHRSLRGGG